MAARESSVRLGSPYPLGLEFSAMRAHRLLAAALTAATALRTEIRKARAGL